MDTVAQNCLKPSIEILHQHKADIVKSILPKAIVTDPTRYFLRKGRLPELLDASNTKILVGQQTLELHLRYRIPYQ